MGQAVGKVIILVTEIGVRDLPFQSAGYGIVTAGIIGLYIGRTNHHFST
jgi:hypothetical protein